MSEARFSNFDESGANYKNREGILSDTGGVLAGLREQNRVDEIRDFERQHPGIKAEFERLIELLPNADDPNKDEFPFTASVVRFVDGQMEVLARSTNLVNASVDSTQHAEMVALQEAQRAVGGKHLHECFLLSTTEPCEMCRGALIHTEVNNLVYAISQEEMRGRHVQFTGGFKPMRTVPAYIDANRVLNDAGVKVVSGYMHDEVAHKMERTVGTLTEYYQDPDAK